MVEALRGSDFELKDRVVHINRVTKVVKGGKNFRFSALVVVGDGRGHVGYGSGKAKEVPQAIAKGIDRAKRNLIRIPMRGVTIPHQSLGLYQRLVEPRLPGRVRERATRLLVSFWSGLESLRSPRNILMVFLTSVVIWLLETGKYWFVMHAFDFTGYTGGFFGLMLMNGIVNLATTIPSAPGYVGTFDTPGIAVLSAYGLAPAVAAGYTLTLHAALWLPITLLGAYYMARAGLRWEKVQAEAGGWTQEAGGQTRTLRVGQGESEVGGRRSEHKG